MTQHKILFVLFQKSKDGLTKANKLKQYTSSIKIFLKIIASLDKTACDLIEDVFIQRGLDWV